MNIACERWFPVRRLCFCLAALTIVFESHAQHAIPALQGGPGSYYAVIIADADPGSDATGIVNAIVGRLQSELKHHTLLQLAQFDAGPRDTCPPHPAVHYLALPMKTPVREALLILMDDLESRRLWKEHSIVVVSRDETYKSWISAERIVEHARQSETEIHSIDLAKWKAEPHPGIFRGIWRPLASGGTWLIDALLDEPQTTRAGTSRMLEIICAGSGGLSCSAADEAQALDSAMRIAARIRSRKSQ